MVQGELPMIDTGGEISSPNVPSGTGGTKSKSKQVYLLYILTPVIYTYTVVSV